MNHNFHKPVFNCLIRVFFAILCTLITFFPSTYAQSKGSDVPPLRERMFFGGSFGLQFGTITDIQVSPVAGLWVLPRLAIAVGPDYRFYKDPYNRTDIYGGSSYLQFVVIQDFNAIFPVGLHAGFFLHLEDELLSLKSAFWKDMPYGSERFFINTVLAGAGIRQPMGRRSSLNLIFLWALNEPDYGIYSNPEIRVMFTF